MVRGLALALFEESVDGISCKRGLNTACSPDKRLRDAGRPSPNMAGLLLEAAHACGPLLPVRSRAFPSPKNCGEQAGRQTVSKMRQYVQRPLSDAFLARSGIPQ